MIRLMINMQNYLICQIVEQTLKSTGKMYTIAVERPQEVIEKCRLLAPDVLLMEVTGYTPWKLEERMKIRDEVKKETPNCKIVLIVDENTEKNVAEQMKQAKKSGIIDLFIYSSTSANYLSALLETL